MAIQTALEKTISDKRFKIFFSFIIAFVLAASVTIDQQAKNLIKLLVVAGFFVTLFNWRQIKRHLAEFDTGSVVILCLYFLSILLSIALNPINVNTLHDLKILSIGITSIFIWSLMVSIRFRTDFFWWGILLCAISTGIYALTQIGMHGINHRAVGSSGKPIMFGDIAMISGIISIAVIPHFRKYAAPTRFIPIIAFVLGITASILSGSRGGWLFLPLALAIVLYFFYSKSNWSISFRTIMISTALLCAAAYLFTTYTNITQRIELAYVEIHGYFTEHAESAEKTSLGQRFEMWKAATTAFEEAPFFGIGPGAFGDHLTKLAEAKQINRQVAEAWVTQGNYHPHSHAHNEYLNTLATRGLVGIGTVLLLFLYFLGRFYRLAKSGDPTKSSIGLAGFLLVSGYVVFALSESVLYHAMTANFFFLSLISLLFLSRKEPEPDSTSTST